MKVDKEYPATHSMSTCWYAVDQDGNVAILSFDDNGPVPVSVPDSSEEEVLFEEFAYDRDKAIAYWPYTAEEFDQFFADGIDVKPEDADHDLYSAVVRVDMSRFEIFSKIAQEEFEEDSINTACIDRERGLFFVDWYAGSDSTDAKIKEAVHAGVITPLKYLSTYQALDAKKDILRGYPFFVYRQDYDSYIPFQRTVVPKKPFTEERLPETAKRKALFLPIRFTDAEKLQIAQYAISESYASKPAIYDNRPYCKYLLPNGKPVYIAESSVILDSCEPGSWSYNFQREKEPTVFIVHDVERIDYEDRWSHEYYLAHSVFVSIFNDCRIKLESNIQFFNPRIILIYKGVIPILKKFFALQDGKITVAGKEYPFFIWEEREKYLESIDNYAHLPYQGGHIRWMIPIEVIDKKKIENGSRH